MLDFEFWIFNEEENEESAFFFDPRSMIYKPFSLCSLATFAPWR